MADIYKEKFYHFARDKEAELFMDSQKVRVWKNDVANRRTNEKSINYSPSFGDFIGDPKNTVGYLKYIENFLELLDQGVDISKHFEKILRNSWYVGYDLNQRFWEVVFERIREENYPNLPSRFGCLYVADKENIIKWTKKVIEDGFPSPIFYELELTGRIHKTHGGWLEFDIIKEDEIIRNSHKYWQGKMYKHPSELGEEILFCGESKIIRKFLSIDEL